MGEGKGNPSLWAFIVVLVAIIGCAGTVVAACIGGVFLLTNTLLAQGIIVIGPGIQVGNPGVQNPTAIPQPMIQPTAVIRQGTQPPTAFPSAECTPPDGLIPLWKDLEPPWSYGIWGSPNMKDFIVGLGKIDTNDPSFAQFQIWLDPCTADTIPGHGYVNGGRFWPLTRGTPAENSPKIPLGGDKATTVVLPANTGIWGLGPPY